MVDDFRDMTIFLWEFPPEDFADWQQLVGRDNEIATIADYRTLLAATQADLERNGLRVERVKMTVRAMEERLLRHGLPNTPDNRAAALAMTEL